MKGIQIIATIFGALPSIDNYKYLSKHKEKCFQWKHNEKYFFFFYKTWK